MEVRTMCISYRTSNGLRDDVSCEDFAPEDDRLPFVFMAMPTDNCVKDDPEFPTLPDGEKFSLKKANDGWVDACVKELNEKTAREVLAAVNNCHPDEIELRTLPTRPLT